MPEDEDSETARQGPSIELPTKDLEQQLDHQADQLGTPTWWGELRLSPVSRTSANLPGRYGHPFMYWRSSSGHVLTMVILHPQLLNASMEGLSCPKDWSIKMCTEGQSSSLKPIADVYIIGQKRSLRQLVRNSDIWQRV